MAQDFTFRGECHCGAVSVALAFTRPASETQVRACQCGFCARHGSMTVSDPDGRTTLTLKEGQLSAYQFATRTATSLLCRACGVYAGAMLKDGEQTWSIINVRGLWIPEFFERPPEPVNYDAESASERIARRKAKWTPTVIKLTA